MPLLLWVGGSGTDGGLLGCYVWGSLDTSWGDAPKAGDT